MRVGRIGVVLALAASAAALAAAAPAAAFTRAQVTAMETDVLKTLAEGGYPGMVVGVWGPGGTFVRTVGRREEGPGPPVPPTVAEHFRVGSITKTMTATVVLKLVEEGRLALDEPLSRFYPGILHAQTITIRQLLDHTSLIPGFDSSTILSLLRVPSQRFDPAEVIGAALTQPFANPPWEYSDTNYVLLGQIVRKVTGRSLAAELRRVVFGPLHLRQTSYDAGTGIPAPAASGYTRMQSNLVDVTHWGTSYTGAAGAVVSTLGDLRRWARALVGGTLLSGRLQKERLEYVQTGHPGIEYGLGIARFAGTLVGHDGLLFGYDTTMLYSPPLQTTFVVLANADPTVYIPHVEVATLVLAGELAGVLEGKQGPPTAPGAIVR